MKRVFISADLEGISGVVHGEHTMRDGREHNLARELMTGEVNAAIQGALAAGATEIVVNDSHGSMRNLYPDKLHSAALLLTGSPKALSMMEGIQDGDFHCAMFVGYHAAMGHSGVLSHTYWGTVVRQVKLNGIELGEVGVNAAVAGYFDVPVALVTGDDRVCAEASALLPGVFTAQVKQARSRYSALGLHPDKARELIARQAKAALEAADNLRPYQLTAPVTMELSFLHSGQAEAASGLPGVEAIDPTTLVFQGTDTMQAFRMLRALITLGGAL